MKNETGKLGEDAAARLLKKNGYSILQRNYHSRFGEIDIIAENREFLVFAEVKTREEGALVSPLEAVTRAKQKKIVQTALLYLQTHRSPLQPRFDVVAVTTKNGAVSGMRHVENAFPGGGYF